MNNNLPLLPPCKKKKKGKRKEKTMHTHTHREQHACTEQQQQPPFPNHPPSTHPKKRIGGLTNSLCMQVLCFHFKYCPAFVLVVTLGKGNYKIIAYFGRGDDIQLFYMKK